MTGVGVEPSQFVSQTVDGCQAERAPDQTLKLGVETRRPRFFLGFFSVAGSSEFLEWDSLIGWEMEMLSLLLLCSVCLRCDAQLLGFSKCVKCAFIRRRTRLDFV